MRTNLKRVLALAVASILATATFTSPALASTSLADESGKISIEDLRTNLPKGERVKFDKLSLSQQEAVLSAALHPESMFNAGRGKWKSVKEETVGGAEESVSEPSVSIAQPAATVRRKTDTHKKTWSMLGIKYASLEARMTYRYNGSKVTSIDSCGGFYTNIVPLRSVQSIPTSYRESKNTKAVCEITWHISKSGGIQNGKSVQGLRVSGKGKRIAYWDYDA